MSNESKLSDNAKQIKGKDAFYAKHKTHTIYWGNDAQQYVLDGMKKKKHTFCTSFQFEGLERHCSFKTEDDGSAFLKAMIDCNRLKNLSIEQSKEEPLVQPRSPSSKKECVADLMNCGSESESEFEDNHKKLSLNTIIRRKKRAHKDYRNSKLKLSEINEFNCDPVDYLQLQNNKKQSRGHFKKYSALEEGYGKASDNKTFYDSDADATPSSQYTDFTGELIDINDLAKEGVSNMVVTMGGKKRKKYKDTQILQISAEITQYFNSMKVAQDSDYFKDIETLDKKERYDTFSSLVKKFKDGRGSIAGFKLLIDASSNNLEMVCKLLEDEFQSRITI